MNLTSFLKNLIDMIRAMIPFLGERAHGAVERAVTIPEKDIRKMMGTASEETKLRAIQLGRIAADAVSDFTVYVASNGHIVED